MSKKLFTDKEIKLLDANPYVKNVSSKGITYMDEFKEIFILESKNGKLARDIFDDYGLDKEILGAARILGASKRWKNAFKKFGIDGLRDTRKDNSGQTFKRELSKEEKYAKMEAELALVKAENELLKKIKQMVRGW